MSMMYVFTIILQSYVPGSRLVDLCCVHRVLQLYSYLVGYCARCDRH